MKKYINSTAKNLNMQIKSITFTHKKAKEQALLPVLCGKNMRYTSIDLSL